MTNEQLDDQGGKEISSEISKASKEGLPAKSRRISASFEYEYVGALPPPAYLQQYEQNHPGFAERLLVLSEREQNHRHGMEELYLRANIDDQKRWRLEGNIGQVLAFVVSMSLLGGGVYCAVNDAQFPGAIMGATSAGGLAAAFIKGRQDNSGLDG